MTTTEDQTEKLYGAYSIEWDRDEERYIYNDEITWKGQPLEFDTYQEFLNFMESLTPDEKGWLDIWRIENNETEEYLTITDGTFQEVSFLSLHAARTEQ